MVNITFNVSDMVNITIDTITPYKYCVTPDYNGILLIGVILLLIPYFNINIWLAKKLNISPKKDSDSLGTKLYKRLFNDFFYVGNAFYLLLGFLLYNLLLG
ncbi:hypothetical protein AYK24_08370 [Thermoplasmatales archaeon SG8-52-4]|nr:MAG: hypothetical protein AYK24_08370 [Thermoplasmatales archaeon SG8-52-4]